MRKVAGASIMKKPTTETAVITPSEQEHRASRRVKVSRPLLARPSDPKCKEEVQVTLNTSRDGLYFRARLKHYHVGMRVSVILGYPMIAVIPRLSGRLFGSTSLRIAASESQFRYCCADGYIQVCLNE